jgi:hypothetical protein
VTTQSLWSSLDRRPDDSRRSKRIRRGPGSRPLTSDGPRNWVDSLRNFPPSIFRQNRAVRSAADSNRIRRSRRFDHIPSRAPNPMSPRLRSSPHSNHVMPSFRNCRDSTERHSHRVPRLSCRRPHKSCCRTRCRSNRLVSRRHSLRRFRHTPSDHTHRRSDTRRHCHTRHGCPGQTARRRCIHRIQHRDPSARNFRRHSFPPNSLPIGVTARLRTRSRPTAPSTDIPTTALRRIHHRSARRR